MWSDFGLQHQTSLLSTDRQNFHHEYNTIVQHFCQRFHIFQVTSLLFQDVVRMTVEDEIFLANHIQSGIPSSLEVSKGSCKILCTRKPFCSVHLLASSLAQFVASSIQKNAHISQEPILDLLAMSRVFHPTIAATKTRVMYLFRREGYLIFSKVDLWQHLRQYLVAPLDAAPSPTLSKPDPRSNSNKR